MAPMMPPPRVGIRQGGRTLPAIPVSLRGDQASLVLPDLPPEDTEMCLVLDWASGAVTELEVRVRYMDDERRLAYLQIESVDGDWQPFLAYLGRQEDE